MLTNIRKVSIIFLALSIFITAFENIFTFVDIKYYGLTEVGSSQHLIGFYGLEWGLLLAFLISTSPSIVLFTLLRYIKNEKWKEIPFYVLGASSLANLPAAINDGLAMLYGYGPLIGWMKPLALLCGVIGFFIAIITFRRFSRNGFRLNR